MRQQFCPLHLSRYQHEHEWRPHDRTEQHLSLQSLPGNLSDYNREEGATKLAAQGWVSQLNVIEEMRGTGANSDTLTALVGMGIQNCER